MAPPFAVASLRATQASARYAAMKISPIRQCRASPSPTSALYVLVATCPPGAAEPSGPKRSMYGLERLPAATNSRGPTATYHDIISGNQVISGSTHHGYHGGAGVVLGQLEMV